MRILKTILLVVSSALGGIVLFVVGVYGWFIYTVNTGGSLPSVSWSSGPRSAPSAEVVVSTPPEIKERFLGSSGRYSGEFIMSARDKILAGGPGTIAGSVTSGGKPASGLRLRLALNGSVMSQWAETDAAGKYAIGVPYGKYRVDGYDLDPARTNAILSGKTDGPANQDYESRETMTVAEGTPGRGPALEYVDPVIKIGPKGEVSSTKAVVLQWQAYPKASAYRVQLTEQKDEHDYSDMKQLLGCCKQATVVTETSLALAEHGVKLRPGYVYAVYIEALDAERRTLADSSRRGGRADFKAAE
jgi:hypothetical protein